MRTVTLSTREFYAFKLLASFWFELTFKQGLVFVTADADALAELGY